MERIRTEAEYIIKKQKTLNDGKKRILNMRKRLRNEFVVFCHGHNIDGEKLIHDVMARYEGRMSFIAYNFMLRGNIVLQEEWKEIQNNILYPFLISFIKKLGNADYRLLRYSFFSNTFIPIEKVGIYNLYSRTRYSDLLAEQINYWNNILMDVTNVRKI